MKIVVDEMPKEASECLFVEDSYELEYDCLSKCTIDGSVCRLNYKHECPHLIQIIQ